MQFRPEIEGLRAVTVLLVVLFHAGLTWTPGGYIGVDVFFTLSGFLISGLLVAQHRSKGTIDLVSFYARRARRLLPASVLMTLAVVVATAALLPPAEQRAVARTSFSVALFSSNLYFARESGD